MYVVKKISAFLFVDVIEPSTSVTSTIARYPLPVWAYRTGLKVGTAVTSKVGELPLRSGMLTISLMGEGGDGTLGMWHGSVSKRVHVVVRKSIADLNGVEI